ncbi:MAG TPA: prepilin-type N-terminal cleavage/methylation domain-containing protein [Gemmatimonadales bacterium]|nr:prepilin-type N-terminal cleavage/methylation domain-containing protein [Gemmatimonadales bacterium]
MRTTRRGFTMIELALTVVVVGILATMAVAKVGSTISRSKVDRAASIVAADLENAFSTGGRLRQPLILSCDCPNRIYRLNDVLNDGALRLERGLGAGTPYTVTSMTFTPATVTILPPGRLSAALEVDITVDGKTRRITMSSAGFVRITTPPSP